MNLGAKKAAMMRVNSIKFAKSTQNLLPRRNIANYDKFFRTQKKSSVCQERKFNRIKNFKRRSELETLTKQTILRRLPS